MGLRQVTCQLSREHLLEHVLPLTKRLAQARTAIFSSQVSPPRALLSCCRVIGSRLVSLRVLSWRWRTRRCLILREQSFELSLHRCGSRMLALLSTRIHCPAAASARLCVPHMGNRASVSRCFLQLCRDDTPMVRRAASAHLSKLAAAMRAAGEVEQLRQDVLPLFSVLSTDEQDSVRLMGVENCAAMGKLLSEHDNRDVVLPIIRAVAQDKSWRVRYVVAEHICELLPHVGPEAHGFRSPPLPAPP